MELEPQRTTLRLTVPEAIDAAGATGLADALTEAQLAARRPGGDGVVPAVILSGRPGLFCRGLDLEKFLAQSSLPPDANAPVDAGAGLQAGVAAFARLLRTLREYPAPVLAAIDGAVLGGGIGVAAACDLVIATRRSSFGLPEGLFGLIPAVVLPVLQTRISPARARLLAMTAYSRGADEAQALGLVDVVCADEKLESAVNRSLRDVRRIQGDAVAALKRFSAEIEGLPLSEGLERGVRETTTTLSQPATLSAVRSFLAEGEAPWA